MLFMIHQQNQHTGMSYCLMSREIRFNHLNPKSTFLHLSIYIFYQSCLLSIIFYQRMCFLGMKTMALLAIFSIFFMERCVYIAFETVFVNKRSKFCLSVLIAEIRDLLRQVFLSYLSMGG